MVLTVPKNVGREVLFIGFGMNLLEKVKGIAEKQGFILKVLDKTHVVIEGLPVLENFAEWRRKVMVSAEFDYNKRLLQKGLPNNIVTTKERSLSNGNLTVVQQKSNENEMNVTELERPIVQNPLAAWSALGQWMFENRKSEPAVRPQPEIINPFTEKRRNPPTSLELSAMISVRELCSIIFELTAVIPAKQRPVYGDRLRELTMRLHEELFVTVERAKREINKIKIYEWLVRIQGGLIFLIIRSRRNPFFAKQCMD